MLKKRIIPTLLYKDTTLVKGISFNSWRRVGSLMQSIKVYNMREVDELIFLDITATKENRRPDFNLIDDFADECFMPLTVGGGIKTIEDIRELLRVGADKVCLNTSAVENPDLIQKAANEFGSQCIVISIDVKKVGTEYHIYTHSGSKYSDIKLIDFLKNVEKLGAGELIVTSIDKDGTMSGYDLELLKILDYNTNLPIIASGGASSYADMLEALKIGSISAVAAASIFHFTEQTPLEAKKFLRAHNIPVRI